MSIPMGVGIFCACARVPEVLNIRQSFHTADLTVNVRHVLLRSELEACIRIITAYLSTLKSLFEKMLRHIGLTVTMKSIRQSDLDDNLKKSQRTTQVTLMEESNASADERRVSQISHSIPLWATESFGVQVI